MTKEEILQLNSGLGEHYKESSWLTDQEDLILKPMSYGKWACYNYSCIDGSVDNEPIRIFDNTDDLEFYIKHKM